MTASLDAAVLRWFNDLAGYGIFTTDAELRIRSWNSWLEVHTGRPAADVIGRPLLDVLPELETRGFTPYYADTMRGQVHVISQALHGYFLSMRARVGNRKMPQMPQTARIAPLSEDGRVVGTITMIEDVSERTLRETELRSRIDELDVARQEAEAAIRAKDQFLATLSHELRTPLTAVMGWTRILRTHASNPTSSARALEIIERNAASQVRLIDDLLDMSRILTGKLRIDVKPVDLAAIVSATVEVSAPAAATKGVDLRVRTAPRLAFIGDTERLQQIVWNLVSNAVKFTPAGGTIDVEVLVEDAMAVIRVRDTGQGIAPEFLPYLFTRFRQADSSTSRRHGGLGIGLALVRELVELHGGTVTAESEGLGHGATLTVRFSLAALRLRDADHGASGEPASVAPLDGITILVVDDEPDTRDMLRTLLASQGADVSVAASAEDALSALAYRPMDASSPVIISDLAMPGEDGYELLDKLQGKPSLAGVRTIALTALATPEERERALEAGFDAYLTKPADLALLTATVVSVVNRTGKRPG